MANSNQNQKSFIMKILIFFKNLFSKNKKKKKNTDDIYPMW